MLIVYLGVFLSFILWKINNLSSNIKVDYSHGDFLICCSSCTLCIGFLLNQKMALSFCIVYKCFNNVNNIVFYMPKG